MGAANVAAVLAVWGPRLGSHHAARVALVVMANTSLDNDKLDKAGQVIRPKCVYFGGWQAIASALGLGGTPSFQQQHVSRHLRVLTKEGAIEMVRRPAPGQRNARYLIRTLAPQHQAITEPTKPERLPLKDANACPSGTERLPLRDGTLAPQHQAEEYEDPSGAKSRPSSPSKGEYRGRASSVDNDAKLARTQETRRRLDAERAAS